MYAVCCTEFLHRWLPDLQSCRCKLHSHQQTLSTTHLQLAHSMCHLNGINKLCLGFHPLPQSMRILLRCQGFGALFQAPIFPVDLPLQGFFQTKHHESPVRLKVRLDISQLELRGLTLLEEGCFERI